MYKKKYKKYKSKYTEAESLAYKLGQINNGLKNQDSRVYESYVKGLNGTNKKKQKPLF